MIRGITIFSSSSDINDETWSGDGEYLELYNSRDKPESEENLTHAQFINILARLCIYGMFGNGSTRAAILGSIYDEVQKEVNRLYAETGN